MRNKKYVWPTTLALALLFGACGSTSGTKSRADGSQTKSVSEALASGQQATESQKAASTLSETADATATSRVVEEGGGAPVNLGDADGTGLDLMKLSATMIFSKVYNIMVNPDSYMGKTIRMRGLIAIYHDETKDTDYYSCIVQDATVCCTQDIEFKLVDDYRFPNGYPPEGSEITMRGRLGIYKKGEYRYAILKDIVLEEVNTENEGETTVP